MADVVKVPYGSENQWSPVTDTTSTTPDTTTPVAAAPTGIVKIPYGSEDQWSPLSDSVTAIPATTDAQAAANRSALGNYGRGLKEGAQKFGHMITDGLVTNSPSPNPTYSSMDPGVTSTPMSTLWNNANQLDQNLLKGANYLSDAVVANTPLTGQAQALGSTLKDVVQGVIPPSQDRLDSHDLTYNPGGKANFGNDKYGNPISFGKTFINNLDDIRQENSNEANQTTPQFFNTAGTIGSTLLPPLRAAGPLAMLARIGEAESIPQRLIAATGTGGLYGTAQGASDADWHDPSEVIKDAGYGGLTGLATGFTIPAISSAAESATGKLLKSAWPETIPGMPNEVRDNIIKDLKGVDSDAVLKQRAEQQGPEGMFMNLNPSTTSSALGTAIAGLGEPQNKIFNSLADQARGMPARVSSDIDLALGRMDDTQRGWARNLTNQAADIGENRLLPIVRTAAPIDAKPLVDYIDSRLSGDALGNGPAVGAEKAALQNIRNDLVTPGKSPVVTPPTKSPGGSFTIRTPTIPAVPDSTMISAEKLNEVRKKISDMTTWGAPDIGISNGAQIRKMGSLKYLGGQTSDLLRAKVPGYGAVMDDISPLMKQREALNFGVDSLHDGSSGADFAHDFAQYGPPGWKPGDQLSDAQKAVQLGMRYGIDSQLGNTKNDAVGLRNLLQNQIQPPGTITPDATMAALPGQGYNSQKIETAFGPAARAQTDLTANREGTFAENNAKVTGGAKTALAQAAQNRAENIVPIRGPFIPAQVSTLTGIGSIAAPVVGAINQTAAALSPKINPMDYHLPMANAYTSKGLDSQNLLAQALRSRDNIAANGKISDYMRRALTYGLGGTVIPTASYYGKNQ